MERFNEKPAELVPPRDYHGERLKPQQNILQARTRRIVFWNILFSLLTDSDYLNALKRKNWRRTRLKELPDGDCYVTEVNLCFIC